MLSMQGNSIESSNLFYEGRDLYKLRESLEVRFETKLRLICLFLMFEKGSPQNMKGAIQH